MYLRQEKIDGFPVQTEKRDTPTKRMSHLCVVFSFMS